jgi:glycosyltransferase involved in cell wall biosynthesis
MKKVSICVVTYNQEKYIKRCLQSLLEQKTDFHYEVIVGDDCSTDKTREIIEEFTKEYPNIFRSILHKKNVGFYGAGNYRAVHFSATGEYIAHVDGDDYWHPNKLQVQVNFMENNRDIAAVYTNAIVESDSGKYLGVFASGVKNKFNLQYLIEFRNFLPASSMLYRQKIQHLIIPKNGEFVDFQIHINIAQQGKIGFIDNNLLSYTYRSTTSLLANNNLRIRQLTWEALCGISPHNIETRSINIVKVVFIFESIIIGVLNRSLYDIKSWFIILLKILNNLSSKEKILILMGALRNIFIKLFFRIQTKLVLKNNNHIFYMR